MPEPERRKAKKNPAIAAVRIRQHPADRIIKISAENLAIPWPGLPLRVVSTFTLGFAILCLCAFLAGRTDLPEKLAAELATRTAALGAAIRVAPLAFANPPLPRVRE